MVFFIRLLILILVVIEEEVKMKSSTLDHREQIIQDLNEKLKQTEDSYQRKLSDLEIKMQQEMYIKELMKGKDKATKEPLNKKSTGTRKR